MKKSDRERERTLDLRMYVEGQSVEVPQGFMRNRREVGAFWT